MPAFYLGKPPRGAIPKIEEAYTTISAVLLKQISPTNTVDQPAASKRIPGLPWRSDQWRFDRRCESNKHDESVASRVCLDRIHP
jgi:hypothetical protein